MLAALAVLVSAPSHSGAEGVCVECVALPPCFSYMPSGQLPQWVFCGSYDHDPPQACTSTLKRIRPCAVPYGRDGDQLTEEYRLGFVCIDDDCF
jgi:hypothetical protein